MHHGADGGGNVCWGLATMAKVLVTSLVYRAVHDGLVVGIHLDSTC